MILKEGNGLFRVRKPKQFNLATRYYDEDKERLNQRIKEIEQKQGKTEGRHVSREMNFRSTANVDWKKNRMTRTTIMTNVRLLVILAALTLGFVYVYNNVEEFSSLFEKVDE